MPNLQYCRLLFCSLLAISVCLGKTEAQSKPCTLPIGGRGLCVAIQRCRNIYKHVKNPTPESRQFGRYIEKAACTLPGVARSICCMPREVRQEAPPTCKKQDLLPKECGQLVTDRISNGNATKVLAYTWMAVIQYNINGLIVGNCGGSLINKRYVLTAAHCIKTRSSFPLHSVILGEHTKNQEIDCNIYRDNAGNEMERECAGPIEEFGIESFKIYQDYNRPKHRHDIGLIRLDRDVTMKDHIQPICLPITEALQTQLFENYIVTGWGATENNTGGSDVLLEANLNHVEIDTCQREISDLRMNVQLSDKQLCARGKGLVDSCRGDSGGPLIASASYPFGGVRFVQLGIVSFGVDSCGQRNAPGVYCRVAGYMDWILEQMECDV